MAGDPRTDWGPFAQTRRFEVSSFEQLTYEWFFVGDVIGDRRDERYFLFLVGATKIERRERERERSVTVILYGGSKLLPSP